MIKDDNNLIWKALTERTLDPYVPAGLEPGQAETELEDEEGPTSNLDKLIGLAAAVSEDAEGVEDINIGNEEKKAKWLEDETPL